jgi:hypothetical protein
LPFRSLPVERRRQAGYLCVSVRRSAPLEVDAEFRGTCATLV